MQEVSQAWKEIQKRNFVSESYVEITLNIGDPESQADGIPSSNGEMAFSDVTTLVNGIERIPLPYATLEKNLWRLNGSMMLLPDEGPYENQGYVGDALCNEAGVFDGVLPTITLSFSKVFTALIPGITITWATAYDEYATKLRITAYAEGVQTYQSEFENSNMTTVVPADIDHYDQITIEVLEWVRGCRRARTESVVIGIEKTYRKAEIMSYSHESMVDPLSFSLPKSEITFELKNLYGEYNPDNPSGAERYLIERQMITARYGYKIGGTIEWIPAGTFFMSEWESPQNGITATFVARDALEHMSDMYTGISEGTLLEIATAALNQASLPVLADGSNRWTLDSSLSEITAPSGLDLSEYTIQEVLQLVANAACCVFYQDRCGIIHIEPLHADTSDYEINRFNSYQNSEISLSKQLKAVDINNGMYVYEEGAVGETQKVDNPMISSERAEIVAKWIADFLIHRKQLSGDFRADPRLDALDRVINQNSFSESVALVTEIRLNFNGAFSGSYEGRVGV